MLCGAEAPGHVPVADDNGQIVGRICSKHSLWEVIRSQQFMVVITHDPEPEWVEESPVVPGRQL